MPTYTITLQGPDGTTERLLYDPHASLLTHDDGRPVDLSPAGFVYGGKSGWETAMAVSSENPGLKTHSVRKLKVSLGFSCNYSCAYCGQASQVGREESTDLTDVSRFLANLDSWWDGGRDGKGAGTNIQFWGGEPFVYWKKLKALAEGIKDRWPSAELSVITNGSVLNKEKIEWLDRLDFAVAVSHDGPGQALRGPDPFEDPEKAAAIRALFDRLHPKGKFSLNVVLTRDHYSLKTAREWFAKTMGDQSVVVGSEELLLPYDPGGLMLSPATDEEHKQIRLALLGEIMDGSALAVSTVWMKLQDWFNSLAQARPASTLGQKCGMDREDNIAVDLKGNVHTCQNTGDAAHRIGHVETLDEVRLTTATHWSLREECRRCPVVQLCKGACMYLEGEYWRRGCDNSFTYTRHAHRRPVDAHGESRCRHRWPYETRYLTGRRVAATTPENRKENRMNRPTMEDGHVVMPEEEFEQLLELAAERGARRALADVGLVDEHAASDIRDLRSLLGAVRTARRTAWQTVVRLITTGLILALIAGVAIKLKLFGGGH